MRVIAYARPDGGVTIVTPQWNDRARTIADDDEFLAFVVQRAVPVRDFIIIEHTDLPDYANRDNWRIVDGKIVA